MMDNARLVYEKFVNGDAISNDELVEACAHFAELDTLLSDLGPVFHLAWLEIHRVNDRLHEYFYARQKNL